MGALTRNLDRKLSRNSIECVEEPNLPTALAATTTKNVEKECCDDKADGHYSHDKSCSRFYQCDQGRLHDMPCSAGLHFNPTIQVCDWPANAGCTLE